MSAIELAGVVKSYGAAPVLLDLDLTIRAGSTTAVLGASGSGKTTMLRLIAGFDRPDAGSVSIGGRIVDGGHARVPAQQRGIGYVPQDGALFPHLTARANVAFGLQRSERGRADELLTRVGLGGLGKRYPHQLSGGEQQRVALARALAIEPEVVLLDEPFNSLDASLRTELGREVVELLSASATTTVLVTHDRQEALALADTVAVLDGGRILALGDPRELYRDPVDETTARSLGDVNVVPAEFVNGRALTPLGEVSLRSPADAAACAVLLRPEQIALAPSDDGGAVSATVRNVYYEGPDALITVELDDRALAPLRARVPAATDVTVGDTVWARVDGPGVPIASPARRAGVPPAPRIDAAI